MKDTLSLHGWIDTNGKFYECGFEQHSRHASDLAYYNVIPKYNEKIDTNVESWRCNNYELILERRGWIKFSSGGIMVYTDLKNPRHVRINQKQKKAIRSYMEAKGIVQIKIVNDYYDINELIKYE